MAGYIFDRIRNARIGIAIYRMSGNVVGFGNFDVILEILIVGFGEIPSIMDAPAFPAILSGLGYKQRSGEHVLAFPAGR